MRLVLGIEYDGSAYIGWQKQRSGTGVQDVVEAAIARVADEPVEAVCAGRTDAGVHASGQVAHFDTSAVRTLRGWLLGINANLPPDVNITWVEQVGAGFHARYSAESRTYRYLILNRLVRSALHRERAWWVHEKLDAGAMQAAAESLLGEHDFSAFRAAGCQAKSASRTVMCLQVARDGDWLAITITANAFLQHMVRNIAGTLVAIGRSDHDPGWARRVLDSRDRRRGGIAAPAHGLTLVEVRYPAHFGLPKAGQGQSPILRL